MKNISIVVDNKPFDIAKEIDSVRALSVGAISSFVGTVRDIDDKLESMTLEYYPQMTKKCLLKIANDAMSKFDIRAVRIHHRVGILKPMEDIVMVICSSAHRGDSIRAVNYVMDYLKTDTPFWKFEKNKLDNNSSWIEQQQSDLDTKNSW